jgi:protein N-terminal methyltransferase
MLGGFSTLHEPDIKDSSTFLSRWLPTGRLALDVGAGIGRVASSLLAPHFDGVSVLESDSRFISQAQSVLDTKLHRAYNCRLQDYRCEEFGEYDLVWIQWVLMYASDSELFSFLEECKKSIRKGGFIGIKENTLSSEGKPVADRQDHSIVRCDEDFRKIFQKAGLNIVDYAIQKDFPSFVYPVRLYLLQPL